MNLKLSISLYLFSLLISSCISIEKVKTGEQALDRKQFYIATQLLEQEIRDVHGSQKAYTYFLLGDAYRLQNKPSMALANYLKSHQAGLESEELLWEIGMMYKRSGDYAKAIAWLDPLTSSNNLKISLQAKRERDICRQVLDWTDKEPAFEATQYTTEENSSVYFSAISPEGKLVLSTDGKHAPIEKKYKWTGRYLSKIEWAEPAGISKPEPLPGWQNHPFQQGSASFNSSFTEMIFTRCGTEIQSENHCQLYTSRFANGKWSEGNPLGFTKSGVNYSHPFISGDSILFFSSDDPTGTGAYDLYFSRKINKDWGKPILLPSPVNTPGNEKFPTVREDTLYFSSDYLPGYGGLDIFSIHIRPDGSWSAPNNLHAPVNSSADDFGIQFFKDANHIPIAFFNSSRGEPEGLDKIFGLIPMPMEQDSSKIDSLDVEIQAKKDFQLFLSLKIIEKVRENEKDPNSRMIGKRPIGNVEVHLKEPDLMGYTRTDGRYITGISFDTSYTIFLSKSGFLQKEISIPPESYPKDTEANEIQTLTMEIEMIRPFFDQEVELQNIYYDLDKWDIRKDAEPTLDELNLLLKANPTLKVMIGSHTDCRADEAYNLELSEKRAAAVVEYLADKGIEKQRMSYTGFGKSRLIEKCICEECSEKQHQKNRRTTFILSK